MTFIKRTQRTLIVAIKQSCLRISINQSLSAMYTIELCPEVYFPQYYLLVGLSERQILSIDL